MSNDRHTRDSMSIEETPVSNRLEITAIVEVLERKGLCSKQDFSNIITEFRHKIPHAPVPQPAFPKPYLLAETENEIIDNIMELLNKNGLTSHQSANVLERLLGWMIGWCNECKGDDEPTRMRRRDHGMQTGGPPPRFAPESIPIHTSFPNDHPFLRNLANL
jgi:hypothetical protein